MLIFDYFSFFSSQDINFDKNRKINIMNAMRTMNTGDTMGPINATTDISIAYIDKNINASAINSRINDDINARNNANGLDVDTDNSTNYTTNNNKNTSDTSNILNPPLESEDSKKLEKMANDIFSMTKCMVCNGETIKDSETTFARSLRKVIVKMLNGGYTQDDILKYISERYGDDAIMINKPNHHTYIIWLLPIVFLLFIIYKIITKRDKIKSIFY